VYLSLLFCSYFVVLRFLLVLLLYFFLFCIFIFVCINVGLLPPGESPIAVNNNHNKTFPRPHLRIFLTLLTSLRIKTVLRVQLNISWRQEPSAELTKLSTEKAHSSIPKLPPEDDFYNYHRSLMYTRRKKIWVNYVTAYSEWWRVELFRILPLKNINQSLRHVRSTSEHNVTCYLLPQNLQA
jgi:hypothetical protein